MKKSNKCPKCDSTKIITLDHGSIDSRSFATIGVFRIIGVKRYVCTECGYIEEWIDPPARFSELAQTTRIDMLPEKNEGDNAA